MPIYEFLCQHCKTQSELLVRNGEKPTCPACHRETLERQLSVIATPASSSGKSTDTGSACQMPRCCGGVCRE